MSFAFSSAVKSLLTCSRSRSTILVPSWAASSVDGSGIDMVASRPLALVPVGLFSAHVSKLPPKTTRG